MEQEWSKISEIRSVSDFKQISSYSLHGDNEYKEVPPGGKIEHGTLGETSYTNQAKSYARLLGLDRGELRNDDMGVFAQVSKKLGLGGTAS